LITAVPAAPITAMNLNGHAHGFLRAFFREDQQVEGGFAFRDELKALNASATTSAHPRALRTLFS